MRIFTFILATLFACHSISAQGITGSWKGKLDFGAQILNIVFNFSQDENGNHTCTMDSPDQNAKGIKATVDKNRNDSVSVSIPSLGLQYEGVLKNGKINGVFKQYTITMPLTLGSGEVVINRPQTPNPPFPYETKEVTFNNTDANVTLAGTLTYPVGYNKKQAKNTPIVIMVTGSGPQDRDEFLFMHKPFLVIADYLARNGIASLRYDDRGVGKSTGSFNSAVSSDFKNDASAGIDYVKSLKEFGKIGILGHSEGGSIAISLAAEGKTDFIVSLAGPAIKGDSILVEQNNSMMLAQGIPFFIASSYCKALSRCFKRAESDTPITDVKQEVETILSETGVVLPDEYKANLVDVFKAINPWLKSFISHDPKAELEAIKCPVMAINGSHDLQVGSKSNIGAFNSTLKPNKKNLIKEYPGLNHLFQHCATGAISEYGTIEETISPEVLSDIATWIPNL